MRRTLVLPLLFLACAFAFVCKDARAQSGHYTSGLEATRAATLPPEGLYYRMYNVLYTSERLRDDQGNSVGNLDVDLFCWAHRFIWTTPVKILGGDLGGDVVIPLVYTDIRLFGAGDNNFGLGDILLEPVIIAWHGAQWDSLIAFGAYMPTGDFDATDAASPGKGFWSPLVSIGGTYYFDAEKTWSASILARYEWNTRQDDTDITYGDSFHFEWGVGKYVTPELELALAGYCHWQVTDDDGPGAKTVKERSYGIGPEIGVDISFPVKAHVALRSIFEFGTRNTTQGNLTALVFTMAL